MSFYKTPYITSYITSNNVSGNTIYKHNNYSSCYRFITNVDADVILEEYLKKFNYDLTKTYILLDDAYSASGDLLPRLKALCEVVKVKPSC